MTPKASDLAVAGRSNSHSMLIGTLPLPLFWLLRRLDADPFLQTEYACIAAAAYTTQDSFHEIYEKSTRKRVVLAYSENDVGSIEKHGYKYQPSRFSSGCVFIAFSLVIITVSLGPGRGEGESQASGHSLGLKEIITEKKMKMKYNISLSIYGSAALLLDLGRFFSFLNLYIVGRTPWTGDRQSQGRCLHTEQHKHRINAHRLPCLEWDSNPLSQCLSERRQFMP
jgi:hypothetical protein